MARVDLTDHMIRKLVVEVRTDFADARAPGLSLRVTPAGSKTWAVRGTALDGSKQRLTIGSYPDISLKDARIRAATVMAEIRAAAGNLNAAKREAALARTGDPTLGELVAEYEAGPGAGLCCTNPVRDSSHETRTVAGLHEPTRIPDIQNPELASLQ
ncbi:Arm DNA-binding domain-containing protein [Paracoccus aminovorans]|uniref:Arm DNA-binding domain-containing protein n=1 Tax=Paracoccus aminovorans TaxID=34004 RepID=UPI002B263659|nr:Arm DNA-binding domain-containing protein [Paracoccus aminovorans]